MSVRNTHDLALVPSPSVHNPPKALGVSEVYEISPPVARRSFRGGGAPTTTFPRGPVCPLSPSNAQKSSAEEISKQFAAISPFHIGEGLSTVTGGFCLSMCTNGLPFRGVTRVMFSSWLI